MAVRGRQPGRRHQRNADAGQRSTQGVRLHFRVRGQQSARQCDQRGRELTVVRDTNPPTLLGAYNVGQTNVTILFSKPVNPATAANAANYAISPAAPIASAAMIDNQTVALRVSGLSMGANYVVTVNAVQDFGQLAQHDCPQLQDGFTTSIFEPGTIGQPTPNGSIAIVSNGVNVSAGGAIGGTADAAPFEYFMQSGNFDFSVCVDFEPSRALGRRRG